jgi:hypothetical protein
MKQGQEREVLRLTTTRRERTTPTSDILPAGRRFMSPIAAWEALRVKRPFPLMALLTTFACSSLLEDDIFVTNYGANTIGEYTTAGAVVNASLISGLNGPEFIAVSGSDLFVANSVRGTVGEYTTSGLR